MKAYKLTDSSMRTYGGCQWVLGEAKTALGTGQLCTPRWLHYYSHPALAVLFNPIHAALNPQTMRLFEATATGKHKHDRGLKSGCTKLTLVRELPVPVITNDQRVEFAIRVAMTCCHEAEWLLWAQGWIDGTDRSTTAAAAATRAATVATTADATAATYAAATAANAAHYANAAAAATYAANAADDAAAENVDFEAIIEEVMNR